MSGDYDAEKRDQVLKQTAEEYSTYLQVDATPEGVAFDRELESMLTRLEEYGSLLDRTRSESRHTLDILVPQVYSHYQVLQRSFQSIDYLEVLVNRVKEDLIKMEASVSQAEGDLGSGHGFTTVIKPFFFKREQLPTRTPVSPQVSFHPPEIFHAKDYFASAAESSDASSLRLRPSQ